MSVGVILPVHGDGPYLDEALGSVLGQEPPPEEVVVVDDGSRRPVRVSTPYADRCRLVRLPDRAGPAGARDAGLAALRADLVALADADDVWQPGKLAAQLGALERHPEAAVCFGPAVIVTESGRPTGERWEWPEAGLLDRERFARELYLHNPIPMPTALVRRESVEGTGGFVGPAPRASDYDLWLRLAERGDRFVYEPRAVVHKRRHPGSYSFDVASLAESVLVVRAARAGLVDEDTRRRVRARDLRSYAQGLVRHRRYGEARLALEEARALAPASARFRTLGLLLRVPGLRAALGRRDPYRAR